MNTERESSFIVGRLELNENRVKSMLNGKSMITPNQREAHSVVMQVQRSFMVERALLFPYSLGLTCSTRLLAFQNDQEI